MTPHPYAAHLTDEQWLVLIDIVSDDEEAVITYPPEPGREAVVTRKGVTTEIAADGTRKEVTS